MKYFGHDCNAGDDARLHQVRLKYGIEGYGVYFRCCEFIGSKITDSYQECILEQSLDLLADDFKMTPQKIKEVLEYFVVVGLFDKTKTGQYRNLKLLTRLDRYTENRIRMQSKQSGKGVYTPSTQGVHKVDVKEKKRKETKRKENKPALQNLKVEGVLQRQKREEREKAAGLHSERSSNQGVPATAVGQPD